MPIIAAPLYFAGLALLAVALVGLLVLESFNREWAHALAVGLVVTAGFCYGWDRWERWPRAAGAATPAPGMQARRAGEAHPSLSPSEIKSAPKIFKNKKVAETFSAPYGTKLVRANYAVTHLLMSTADLKKVYFDLGVPENCRDADHAIECACSKADECSNAPR